MIGVEQGLSEAIHAAVPLHSGGDIGQQYVWYASYGSNMHSDRFMAYIKGGQAAGVSVAHPGCADPTPPTATKPIELPKGLFFAGESWHWLDANRNKMGAAFTTLEDSKQPTLGLAYRITFNQFLGVVAQENDVDVAELPSIDLDRVIDTNGSQELFPGDFYSTLQYNGTMDGEPVLSFTGFTDPSHKLNRPALGYLWVIGRGLMKAHGLDEAKAGRQLALAPGAEISPDQLAHVLAGDQPKH